MKNLSTRLEEAEAERDAAIEAASSVKQVIELIFADSICLLTISIRALLMQRSRPGLQSGCRLLISILIIDLL